MSFDSILRDTPYGKKASELEYSSFFQDLNLDQLVERMLRGWEDYPLLKYFYYPAASAGTVNYRKEIYNELRRENVRAAVASFSRKMKRARKFMEYRRELERRMQCQDARKLPISVLSASTATRIKHRHLLCDGAKLYIQAVTELCQALEEFPCSSEGLKQLTSYLKEYCGSVGFQTLKRDARELTESLKSLRFQMVLTDNKLTLYDEYDSFDAREEIMARCGFEETPAGIGDGQAEPREMKSPFPSVLDIKEFEGLLLSMLQSSRGEVFDRLERFEKNHEDFFAPELLQFEEEVQVYLAAGKFIDEMERYGFAFTGAEIPGNCPDGSGRDFSGRGSENFRDGLPEFYLYQNYDIALACKHLSEPEKVIANDCYLMSGEKLFIITGPNQGGKTTFARAVGQAVYFNQMGFPVAGTKAALPVFSVLFTHFPAEEELESGAGKLKEELKRLEPMLSTERTGGFVILNELFTTATTYDGKIMGADVIHRFLDRGFSGIYVTHLKELAECDGRLVSLVAQVEDSDSRIRTYRIRRAPAKGLAYAQTIAQKYRLSHDEVIGRIKSRNREPIVL